MRYIWGMLILIICLPLKMAAAQDRQQIDGEMERAIEQIILGPIPGISVAVANKNELLWAGSAGYSDIESEQAVSPSHLFGLGDLTSQFIGMLIFQLAEEGYLNLEQTPADILGEKVANIENADTATLSQLLNHTSGIFSWSDDPDWKRRARGIQLNPAYQWAKDEQLKYITLDQHTATHSAGSAYYYSKSNYTLLALIAEQVTGGLIDEEIRTRIYEPNNLKDTYFQSLDTIDRQRQVGSYHLGTNDFISKIGVNAKFSFEKDRLIKTSDVSLSSEGLASGMVSTPRDVALLAAAHISKSDALGYTSFDGSKGLHSEILGYTADIRLIEAADIVVVSVVNLGIADTGVSDTAEFLRTYVDRLLLPIAKKYSDAN